MRSVLIVSRNADLAPLAQELERTGLQARRVAPEQLAAADTVPRADVTILDLREITPSALALLLSGHSEQGGVVLALVPADGLTRITQKLEIDDFALLPAQPAEVVRRIERALWRRHGLDSEDMVRCGALTLDLANYRVVVESEAIALTFKEYELLRFLAMNAGRVFTREQLLNRVWGYDYFGGARTVDVHIRRIRSKVEVRGHTFIETVRNVGYRLVAEARKEPVGD